jgi:ABC-2 type transport system permease protein
MIQSLRRKVSVYGAIAATVPKLYLAYRVWFWVGIILNVIGMTIYVFFWRAVYANTTSIAGMDLQQTLNYILLARIFAPLMDMNMIFEFGYNLREGGIANVLLRPLDLQGSYYVETFSRFLVSMLTQVPMALIATFVFGLRWPTDPLVWLAFLVSLFLGRTALYFFDWSLGCLTFYTTEVWGLGVLLDGLATFFSGALIPLVMMPGWLQGLSNALPFAQSLYVPLSLLTGISPIAQVLQVWLVQIAWIAGMFLLSRLLFSVAIRKVTIQGG